MDSVTQAVLGAVVANISMGKQLGRRAAVWGLVLGTLPDLDVMVAPWLTTTELMSWHRGISHGLLAILLLSPFIGWGLSKWYHQLGLSWCRATVAAAFIWLTHVLIDCFNLYGTGLWEPFSSSWVSFGLMFIIDPLFTIPLLVATLVALCWSSRHSWRLPLTWSLFGLSCCYVIWAVTAKTVINKRFEESLNHLAPNTMHVRQWHSGPTPLNTILWRCLAQVEHDGQVGFLIGLASLLDDNSMVVWRWVPQIVPSQHLENPLIQHNDYLIVVGDQTEREISNPYLDDFHVGFETARWFSQGYWLLVLPSGPDQKPIIHDLRFGAMVFDHAHIDPVNHSWAFSWTLMDTSDGKGGLKQLTPFMRDVTVLPSLWSRLLGERYEWEVKSSQVYPTRGEKQMQD